MSANYTMISRPSKWVSAHRKCEFVYRLPQALIVSGYDDGNGYLKINLTSPFPFAMVEGDTIYITDGTYRGFHKIRTVHSTLQYTINTSFILSLSGSIVVWQVILPKIPIYRGYEDNELILPLYPSGSLDMNDIQPKELLGVFTPSVRGDGYMYFDISGYIKSALRTPYRGKYNSDEVNYIYAKSANEYYLPMNVEKINFTIERNNEVELIAHNSSIETRDLISDYLDSGRPLTPLKQRAIFSIGRNDYDTISSNINTPIRHGN